MAAPSTAVTRTELGSTYNEFDLNARAKGFIGTRVLRPRMSAVQAADVPLIPLEAQLQLHNTDRAPGATYKRGDFDFTKYSFSTEEHGWEEPVDDRTVAMFRDLIEAEAIHAARAVDFVTRGYEVLVAAAVYDTAVWTGAALTTAVGIKWDVYATAVPVTNVLAVHEKIKDSSGMSATGMTMNDTQMRDLIQVDQIISRLKFWGGDDPKSITPRMLSELFLVPEIFVANYAIKNTASPQAAAVISNIWANADVMVGRFAQTDDPGEPCIGRTIMWSEETAGPGTDEEIAVTMEEYREEVRRGGVMRARTDYAIKIIQPECGHLLTNIK